MAMPPNIRSTLAAVLVASLGGCSIVPDASWPPAQRGELELVYRFEANDPRVIRMPASDDEMTVLWIEADPPVVTERFVDGERIWIAPAELDELRVRCGYTLFGSFGPIRTNEASQRLTQRFPGSTIVEHRLDP